MLALRIVLALVSLVGLAWRPRSWRSAGLAAAGAALELLIVERVHRVSDHRVS